jgi:hypothetical protein
MTQGHPTSELHPDTVLKGRYVVRGRYGLRGSTFVGTDLESGVPVLLLELPPPRVAQVARAALVGHPHLATLLDVAPTGPGQVGVFEYLAGRTLEDVLADQGTLPERVAVTCAHALTDALDRLHQRGALHGQIRPRAVVLSEQPGQGPWLSRASLEDYPESYRCPEHVAGFPSLADDRWAMGALLHDLLLGHPPPRDGYSDAATLPSRVTMDADLRAVLATALATSPERRPKSAAELRDQLASVEARLAGTEGATDHGLPTGASVAPWALSERPEHLGRGTRVPKPLSSLPRLAGYAASALAVGAASVWLWWGDASRSAATRAPAPGRTSLAPWALPSPAEVLRPRQDSASFGEGLAACIQELFPARTWSPSQTAQEICTTRDPYRGIELLERAFGSDPRLDAPRAHGAYAWATLAIVRRVCCPPDTPLHLAEAGCEPLASSLDELTRSVAEGRPYQQKLAHFQERLGCVQNRPGVAGQSLRPATSAEGEAFRNWLAEVARAAR